MGAKVINAIRGFDYATNEFYFEFHRRITVPKNVQDAVSQLLDAGKYKDAAVALKQAAPPDAHPIIDLGIGEVAKAKGSTYP